MNYSIIELFIIFMLYSFFGWVQEVIRGIFLDKKVVNRGFFLGPYCPIYGVAAILMIILLERYVYDPVVLFFMSIIMFSVLEYSTSFFMEKLFNARWWDYSRRRFNINGRICLETMIPFGIAGLLAMYIVNPILKNCLDKTPYTILLVISIILLVIFTVDIFLSSSVMFNIKGTIKKVKKDNTEEITQKVKELIMQKNYLKKRIIKAFPRLKIK